MVEVERWVATLNRAVNLIPFCVFPNDIISEMQRKYLFEVEHILKDMNGAICVFVYLFFWILVSLHFVDLRNSEAYSELLSAFWALENELLSVLVFLFVEDNVVIAFRASYSFHFLFLLFLLFFECFYVYMYVFLHACVKVKRMMA